MWLGDTQLRCWAPWCFCSNQAACVNHHRAGAEPGRSWGNHFYIKYLAKMRATEGGRSCGKWLWKMKKQCSKINPMLLRKVWHCSQSGERAGRAGRLHICILHILFECALLPLSFFLLMFFRPAVKFCKGLPLPKPTKKRGYCDCASYLWTFFFFPFCFSEMGC